MFYAIRKKIDDRKTIKEKIELAFKLRNDIVLGQDFNFNKIFSMHAQVDLTEEIMEMGLTIVETRDRVRGLLGKELKWRLVPILIESTIYAGLVQIAPDGDVSTLLRQTVEKLISEINQ